MNRLAKETSPYLLQHAHNPVDWFPWGEEALQKARAENKPILVSIGYAACHWCHVMERESFEDVATANLMNEQFINIKIDREERPDLDAIYMEAVQLISGSGGWPLNVFLTPEAKPFYGGTYFPPVQAFNRSSWTQVLQSISEAWQQQRQEILTQAENLTTHIGGTNFLTNLQPDTADFTQQQLDEITINLLKQADKQWGGFGRAPKFPQTFSITYLLRYHHFFQLEGTGDNGGQTQQNLANDALQQALQSLDKMIWGGIYDQLAGGFARYATDAQWQIPHFEKMLYDNALLLSTLSEAYQLTGRALYRQVMEQTMQFVQTDWIAPQGGFYSSYDADSEGVEGKFYTWTKAEIAQIIGEDAPLFCQYYQVTEEGNWEETNILWCKEPLEEFCRKNGLDFTTTQNHLAEAREKLLQVRNRRIKPLLDNKVLLSWNALMITACCKVYAAVGNEAYVQMAETAAAFIEQHMKVDGAYFHNYKGQATIPAFLDDLAFYIQALIHLQETTANQQYLYTAKDCLEAVLTQFSDLESPFFFYTAAGQQDVVVRKKEWYDGATPSGNSVMAWNLAYLTIVFDRPEWKDQAMEMLKQLSPTTIKYPTSFGCAALGLQQMVYGWDEISVNGEQGLTPLRDILTHYWPNKIIQTQLKENNEFPLFRSRWTTGEEAIIFLCRDQVCGLPVTTTRALMQQRRERSKKG
jgi:uncharacterized protein